MRFLHTADLQIGARFVRFGEKAELLRDARLATLKRIMDIGRENAVDAILIAGDLFESNQIADSLVEQVFDLLVDHPEVPVIILPGNHDPIDGPGCIWLRKPFSEPPAHISVCTTREAIEVAGAIILPVPITQKVSTRDPSLPLVESAKAAAPEKIRIGMTHGALAIEGKHQPNDQPIALDAATRAGLDYLALGHWHKPQVYDDGRLAMPGTPEPDAFGQASGTVSIVEIRGSDRPPVITAVDSATFAWRSVTLNLLDQTPTPGLLTHALAPGETPPEQTVLRMVIEGPVSAEHRESLASLVSQATEDYAAVLLDDQTTTILSASLWGACVREHPMLAQIVADVERSRFFATGLSPTADGAGLDEMTLDAFRILCGDLNIDPGALDADCFDSMMGLLTAEIGKAASPDANP